MACLSQGDLLSQLGRQSSVSANVNGDRGKTHKIGQVCKPDLLHKLILVTMAVPAA